MNITKPKNVRINCSKHNEGLSHNMKYFITTTEK